MKCVLSRSGRLATSVSASLGAARARCVAASTSDSGILVEEFDVAKRVILNRPKVLNALNLPMVRAMYPYYKKWTEEHSQGKPCFVVIEGAGGKAFCAGGDVVSLASDKSSSLRKDFFREEYRLNYLIKTMSVAQVALLDGITMGGGVGMSVHGSHRVVTEKTRFAMPETGIGLFPDVGGSVFLPTLPHRGLGMYLALTGKHLKGPDCLHAGIGTHYVPSERIEELSSTLSAASTEEDVEYVLKSFAVAAADLPSFSLSPHLADIAAAFMKPSLDALLATLAAGCTDWHQVTLEQFDAMSPTSLRVTHEQMLRGARQNPFENFQMEARIGYWMLNHGHDFDEGIRALLIDKDKNPKWQPPTLQEVTPEIVAKYFESLGEDDWDPANLKTLP